MSDEITPDAPPEPPAVAEQPPSEATHWLEGDDEIFTSTNGVGFTPLPVFDDSAPLPYAGGTANPTPVPDLTSEQQLAANVQLLGIKLDQLNARMDDVISRVDWIAPRVEWIRSTFSALVDQFGKITPGQVFSMLRGKSPQQEGTTKP